MKDRLFTTVFLFLLLVPDLTNADLPSCQRAKCSHCQVQFIGRMCPNACSSCLGGNHVDDSDNKNLNQHQQSAPAVRAKVATHGQTAFVPNNQQANTIQQTIPNNAGNGPPVLQQNNIASGVPQTIVVQQKPYQPPTNTNTLQLQQFGQTQQQFSAPQTPILAPYQFAPGFGSPFSISTAPLQTSPFFNPFAPQPLPFGGFTFAPPLVPASLPPVFTPAPLIFPQTSSIQSPSVGPIVSQQAVPSYQPYQQVPQPVIHLQPQPTYPQNQSYRARQPNFEHVTNYGKEIQHTRIRQPAKHYSTVDRAQHGGRYSTKSNVNMLRQEQGSLYIHSYNSQARPKQIHSPQTSLNGNIPQPQIPNIVPQAPQILQTNPPTLIQGIPNGVTYPPASIPQQPTEPIINKNMLIGNHIEVPENKIEKATCPRQPNWEPCITKELANERFRNCCQRLGEGCAQLCSYDQNLATLQIAVLTGRCPLGKVADMMICASGYEDATPCCEAYGVFEPGFAHCRPYCNPAAGLPNDGMIAEKYRCLGKISQIQRCFYVTQRP